MDVLPSLPDISHSFGDLSFAADELEAAMLEAAALDAVADATLEEVVSSQGLTSFAAALVSCGLANELGSAPRLTILAPTDAAFAALPSTITADPASLRRLCEAHVCIGDCFGEALHSLQGTVHCAEYAAGTDFATTPAHEARRIGGASVGSALPFAHGCVLLLDSPLFALHVETECRPEQVWQKAVVPAPSVAILGLGGLGGSLDSKLEVHVQLVHVPTGVTLPETALRGGLRRVASTNAPPTTAPALPPSVPLVRFTELAIEHKPSSCARKRAAGAEEQRQQENCYTLAYTLLDAESGLVVCAVRQPAPLTLRNSFHTLSAGEKEYRRALNKPNVQPPIVSPPMLVPSVQLAAPAPPVATTAAAAVVVAAAPPRPVPSSLMDVSDGVGGGGVDADVIASLVDIMPTEGPAEGGSEVWLHGDGLSERVEVRFGGARAVNLRLCSASLLKCIAPPCECMHGAAERTVSVSVDGGRAGAGGVEFTYRAAARDGARRGVDTRVYDGAHEGSYTSGGEVSDEPNDGPVLKRRLISLIDKIDSSMARERALVAAAALRASRAAATDGAAAAMEEEEEEEAARPPTHALVDACDEVTGWTLAHMLAALNAPNELAAVLSRRMCPAALADPLGRTPLHLAVARGHTLVATLLVRSRRKLDLQWTVLWREVKEHAAVREANADGTVVGGMAAGGTAAEDELRGLASAVAANCNAMRAVEQAAHASLGITSPSLHIPSSHVADSHVAESQMESAAGAAAGNVPGAEGAGGLVKEEKRQLSAAAESLRQRLQSVLPGVGVPTAATKSMGNLVVGGAKAARAAEGERESLHDKAREKAAEMRDEEGARREERRERLSRLMMSSR